MHSATSSAEPGPSAIPPGPRRFAVLGSPIAHSLSPALHRAAYRVLGLDWEYGRHEVDEAGLPGFLAGLDERWGGLSLTMPLKRAALAAADWAEPAAQQLDAANTLLFTDEGARAYNTDVPGVLAALAAAGVESVRSAAILGGGATANSVLAALAQQGLETVSVSVRDPRRGDGFVALAHRLEVAAAVHSLADIGSGAQQPLVPAGRAGTADADAASIDRAEPPSLGLIVNTIPASAGFPVEIPTRLRAAVPLFEVSYSPWPTPAVELWQEAGGTVIPGIDMLIHQALIQLRLFLGRDAERPLPDEAQVLETMQAVVARIPGTEWHGIPEA